MDSSETSPAASSTSERDLPFSFVGDPGPGFDPAGAAAREDQLRTEDEAAARAAADLDSFGIPDVSEESIRDFLRNAGDMAHGLAGVGESDWVATQSDLDRIAPAATRIINRYEPTRAIAQKSDEAAVVIGLGMYSWRSMLERQAVMRARERPAGRRAPIDVQPPPPPSGPAPAPPPGASHSPPNGAAHYDVVEGYVPIADRIREARERTPDAKPREDS